MHLVATSRWFGVRASSASRWLFAVAATLALFGCQRGDGSPEATATATRTTSSPAMDSRAPGGDQTAAQKPAESSTVPAWALGVWHGKGSTKSTALALPGNQGVQLAWIQDKGVEHVGPVELRLEVARSGAVRGKLSGALGDLDVYGVWPETSPMTLELRPAQDGPEVFHGMASLKWGPEPGSLSGSLRAARGDGRLLRSADLEVTIASE